jgi:hypothetical protein
MLAVLLVILGTIMRLVPHAANFAPIGAIALFGGVYLNRRYALILPIAALALSDAVIGFDSLESRLTVYGSFLLVGLVGLLVRKNRNFLSVAAGAVSGSIIFYLVTNFALFYPPTMYAHNISGVLDSYYMALPFFRNTLLGDVFYTGLLFGLYEMVIYIAKHKLSTIKTA